jgi:hypothetical protein
MHDVIVVLGGRSDEQGYLNSVESFTMGDDQWKELPGMKEKINFATAVVKPSNCNGFCIYYFVPLYSYRNNQ